MAIGLKRQAIDQGRPWDLSAVVRDALDELFAEIDRLGDHDAKIERIAKISRQPAPRGAALRATCLRIDQRDRLLRWQTNVPITMASAIRAAVDDYLANHPVADVGGSEI
jgi:hypothetical protein